LIAPEGRVGRAACKRQLREQLIGAGAKRREPALHQKRSAGPERALARAVRSRIDVGDVRGASRVVANDGKFVDPDQDAFDVLKAKHPVGEDPPPPEGALPPPLALTLEQLLDAVSRTPAGGAPGPEGLRPVHLKQLVGPRAGAAREALQSALLDFCNICLAGAVPQPIRPLLFGAGLIALRKKDGGLRPIAIGLALRRLVARAACAAVRERAAALLTPTQVGFGVRGGAEAAVHGVRRFLDNATGASGLVKLDFANAFNAVSRTAVVAAVASHLPELERLVRCAYGAESTLLFGDHVIASACGVQQGDPLGPLLFALAIRDISHGGAADLAVWYLDDATIGGTADQVVAEISRIRESAARIGLLLNEKKCEAVSSDTAFVAAIRTALPNCSTVSPGDCDLLGAAVGASAVSSSLAKRASSLRAMATRLASIDHHDALALLRLSLGHPRAIYELRAGASFRDPEALAVYDAALRDTIEIALSIRLDDRAWLQCTLPPLLGGIGVRTPSELALAAFLSSSASTSALADQISGGAPDTVIGDARALWTERARADDPVGLPSSSRTWQRPLDAARRQRFVAALSTPRDVARLHSASRPESAALYRGLPCSRDGTRLTDIELSAVVGLRLGLPVAAHGVCTCREPLDEFGDHALSCNSGVERLRRHDELNSRIRDLLGEAGFPAVLEPTGLAARDARRFDGVTVAAFERGRPMAWDATIIHTCAPSHLHASAVAAQAAATGAESLKAQKYRDLSDRYDFRPIGVETLGAFGPQALELVESLVTRIRAQTGENGVRSRIYRRLAAAVQAGNARRIVEAHSHAASGRHRGAY